MTEPPCTWLWRRTIETRGRASKMQIRLFWQMLRKLDLNEEQGKRLKRTKRVLVPLPS